MITLEQQLFTEVFPVETASLPRLTAYQLQMKDGDPAKIGGKLAYRLRQMFPGHWVWAGGRLLTDDEPNPVKLLMAIDTITKQQPSLYGKLVAVEQDYGWEPTPDVIADYVLRGPLDDLTDAMREALSKTTLTLRNARVEREHRARAWVVDGQPAISFSILSRVIYEPDLSSYATTVDKPSDLVGMQVGDKLGTLQGQVVKVVGPLGDHRERLLGLTQRDSMRELLRAAPDTDLVVKVASGPNEYDYCASALRVIVGFDDTRKYGVDSAQVAKALRLKPIMRAQMVKLVADIAKGAGLIGNAFSTQNAPEPFTTLMPSMDVALGGNRVRRYDVYRLPQDVANFGLYWWRERFNTEPLRVGVVNTIDEPIEDFLEALRRSIEADFGFKLDIVRERKVKVVSQSNLESAVRVFQKEPVDLVLAFFDNQDDDDDDDGATDLFIKSQTIGRGLPCLVIHQSTLHKPEAMPSLVLGILARAGNVPYLFDEPLPYADYVVGLDLIYDRKKDGPVMTGVARLYRNDGALLGYVVGSEPLRRGDGIPPLLVMRLLPEELLAGQRVVIHNDGALKRDALETLQAWGGEIGATFDVVEVVRRGVPRLYTFERGKIARPPWGTTFRLNEREAFLVTAASPVDATPQPAHIRVEGELPIEHALDSVITFTMLHYGALKTPKLPVTVHHAEYIRAAIQRGIIPDKLEGDVPFWL